MMKFCGILGKEDDERKMELWYNKQRLSYHKARKQQINKLVWAHKDLAVAHANYIRSLDSVGCSLLHFASNGDAHLRRRTGPTLSRNNSSGMEKMMTKIQKCFSTAADSGKDLPVFLGWPLSLWLTKKKLAPYRLNHSTTAEKIYDLEKKLYQLQVKLQKIRRRKKKDNEDEEKIEKAMDDAEKDIEATLLEIKKLSDRNLYGDVVKHVEGLMFMWRTMYECHYEQAQILLNYTPFTTSTTIIPVRDQQLMTDVKFEWKMEQELTIQLERDIKQWMSCFCSLVARQRVYIASLNGWLRLINYSYSKSNTKKNKIYSLCKDWSRDVDKIPDKVAKDGIKHLLKTVRAIKVQEQKAHKHDKKCASMWKKLEKERYELMCLECKFKGLHKHSNNASSGDVEIIVFRAVEEKRVKVAELMAKAEDEQRKSINLTRTTHSNLVQLGLPHAIQGIIEFASVCKDAFHSMYAAHNLHNRECNCNM